MSRAPIVSVVIAVGCSLTAAQAQTAGEQAYGAFELLEGGPTLERELFARGWPTDGSHRDLTSTLATEPATLLVGLGFAPGAGVPLTASRREAQLLEKLGRESRIRDTAGLLRQTLSTYKDLSGYEGSLARTFVPSFLPYTQSSPRLANSWREDEPGSWVCEAPGDTDLDMESIGFSLLAQATYAEFELGQTHDGKVGRTPASGFLGLLALHCALAKVYELNRLILDNRGNQLVERDAVTALDEYRYFVPPKLKAKVDQDTVSYSVINNELRSQLGGQAALLLGLCRLARFIGDTPSRGSPLSKVYGSDEHLRTVELALFIFRSIRTLHIDVRLGRALSTHKGTIIQTVDLGLYLLALQSFLREIQPVDKARHLASLKTMVEAERSKALTLVSTLSDSLQGWQQQRPDGFYNVYTVRTNSAKTQAGESLAANAFALRGLVAAHQALADGARNTPHLEAARVAAAAIDRRSWNRSLSAYTEGRSSKAPGFGALALTGALRELALASDDGRYLSRYRRYLESLHANGLYARGEDRTGPHLAAEVTFEAGSK